MILWILHGAYGVFSADMQPSALFLLSTSLTTK